MKLLIAALDLVLFILVIVLISIALSSCVHAPKTYHIEQLNECTRTFSEAPDAYK